MIKKHLLLCVFPIITFMFGASSLCSDSDSYKAEIAELVDRLDYTNGTNFYYELTQLYKEYEDDRCIDAIKIALAKAGKSLLEITDKYGNSPFHLAVLNRNVGLANLILSISDECEQRKLLFARNFHKMTPLHSAAICGNAELAKEILQRADFRRFRLIYMRDIYQNTALHLACYFDQANIVKIIREFANDAYQNLPGLKNNKKMTAMQNAEQGNFAECIVALN